MEGDAIKCSDGETWDDVLLVGASSAGTIDHIMWIQLRMMMDRMEVMKGVSLKFWVGC